MFYFGIVTTILSTALHLIVRAADIDVPYLAGVLKMTASTGFLITALAAGALRSRAGKAILVGLVFSWFGDLFLIGSGSKYFLAGLLAFLCGHMSYIIGFELYSRRFQITGRPRIALVAALIGLGWWILPKIDETLLQAAVLVYMIVITAMVSAALDCLKLHGGRLIVIGALLFYFSDIFVARAAFISPGFINSLFGLPLYFGGQLVLAASIRYIDASHAANSIQNPKSKI